MEEEKRTPNKLIDQTSPYLLQHAYNPVSWYPWGEEAFARAKEEDKPVFLSIGYSTCHWCHVMARESFEDHGIADILDRYFISIKVDREERPDIDSIYMAVCQAMTGSGGWPTSIFMTPDQQPFFAGTYFPKTARGGYTGLWELLLAIAEKWHTDRASLLDQAEHIISALRAGEDRSSQSPADAALPDRALAQYKHSYDKQWGGFGPAPKFPAVHNLLFLLQQGQRRGDKTALEMAEKTLERMYRGGLFDHIGYGFCRYSTDRFFLVPHFEKMLYDNALLIMAYAQAYAVTQKPLYLEVAEKTAAYILREMTAECGGFFSAQDADSEGEEGKYYLFRPEEIIELLGQAEGAAFNEYYGITSQGNFAGQSIPNLLHDREFSDRFDPLLPQIRAYRQQRTSLNTDDKILTSWNALMITALCSLYRVSHKEEYLAAARSAQAFIEGELCQGDTLYVSFRKGRRGGPGFLDDYANYILALLALYDATLDRSFLERARFLTKKTLSDFFDRERGGFYLYGQDRETLLLRPKESYDGALPSGNSVMTYVLVRLHYLEGAEEADNILLRQLGFMSGQAEQYPPGFAMFLMALSDFFDPPDMITAVAARPQDIRELPFVVALDSIVRVLEGPTEQYPLKNGQTTYYVCQGKSCRPPVNDMNDLSAPGRMKE